MPCVVKPFTINGELKIQCEICDVYISPGLHFQTASHKANVVQVSDRSYVNSQCVEDVETKEAEKLSLVDRLA